MHRSKQLKRAKSLQNLCNMAFKIYVLTSLVAATLAEYTGGAMSHGSYPNQLMTSSPYSMPQNKMYSNYLMDSNNMYNTAGMYRSYMSGSGMMAGENAYSGYHKHSSNPTTMSSELTGRYTSTPTTMPREQQYGQMTGHHSNMPYASMSHGSGGQMTYSNYGMDMSRAAQGYAGYAHSSGSIGSSRPMMSGYQTYQHGSGGRHMMMMNDGHNSHPMPTSYISFNGNEANYRW